MLENCIATFNPFYTLWMGKTGKDMFHFKDVYSIYFVWWGMISFIQHIRLTIQSLTIVDIWAMLTLCIIVTMHSNYGCIWSFVCKVLIFFYHSYSTVMPNDMHFLYLKMNKVLTTWLRLMHFQVTLMPGRLSKHLYKKEYKLGTGVHWKDYVVYYPEWTDACIRRARRYEPITNVLTRRWLSKATRINV